MPSKLSLSLPPSLDSAQYPSSPNNQTPRAVSNQSSALGCGLRRRMASLALDVSPSSAGSGSVAAFESPSIHTPTFGSKDKFKVDPKALGSGALGAVYPFTPTSGELTNEDSPLVMKKSNFQAHLGKRQAFAEILSMEKLGGTHSPKLLRQKIKEDGYELVMTKAPGKQLDLYFKNHIDRLPLADRPAATKQVVFNLLSALQAIHSKDVCHRDIKPGNVFAAPAVEAQPLITYIDFGDSSDISHAAEGACGTDKYSLPTKQGRTAAEIDLYSIGRTLAQLTGQLSELQSGFDRQELENLSEAEQQQVAKNMADQEPTQRAFINSLCHKQGLTLSDAINHPWLKS